MPFQRKDSPRCDTLTRFRAVFGLLVIAVFASVRPVSAECGLPIITTQPQSLIAGEGGVVQFSVSIDDRSLPVLFQWRKDGHPISGAIGPSFYIERADHCDQGSYSVTVGNSCGLTNSLDAFLSVTQMPPMLIIRNQPQGQTVFAGESVTLEVAAAQALGVYSVAGPMEDRHCVDVGESAGQLLIDYEFFTFPDSLRVYYDGTRVFDTGLIDGHGSLVVPYGPGSSTIVEIVSNEEGNGQAATLLQYTVAVVHNRLTYQWQKDDMDILDATNASYSISSAGSEHSGTYTVRVNVGGDTVLSSDAILRVNVAPLFESAHRLAGGTIEWPLQGGPGMECVIERSTSLTNWSPAGNVILDINGRGQFTIQSVDPTSGGFYRARVVEQPAPLKSEGYFRQ